MSSVVFVSKRDEFFKKNDALRDMITGHMAIDIERALKTTAGMPTDKGQMKSATRSFKNSDGKYRVEINKEYAAAQEKGEMTVRSARTVTPDGGQTFFKLKPGIYKFRKYTTAGTSSGFFRRAVDSIWRNRASYIDEARRALKL